MVEERRKVDPDWVVDTNVNLRPEAPVISQSDVREVGKSSDVLEPRKQVEADVGQATKGTRGIPWHQQPKKDAVDRERPG